MSTVGTSSSCGLFGGRSQQGRAFGVRHPDLAVFIHDREHSDRSRDVMRLGRRRIDGRHAFGFPAAQRSGADELRLGRREVLVAAQFVPAPDSGAGVGRFSCERIGNSVCDRVECRRPPERSDLNLRRPSSRAPSGIPSATSRDPHRFARAMRRMPSTSSKSASAS